MQQIANQSGALTALPASTEQVVAPDAGSVIESLPQCADGDACSITVTAA